MKTAVITGSNRGLGLALLNEFADSEYNIIACVRKKSDKFSRHCQKKEAEKNVKIYPVYFDLTDKNQINDGMQSIADMGLKIDVLINNAGINISKAIMFTEYQEVVNSFAINYFAPFLITKRISELMVRQGEGAIVNISSMMSISRQPGGSCYNTSKAALNQFTISLAQELARFNVRVNAVACGSFQADMFEGLQEKVQNKLIKASALKRVAAQNEITAAVMFLASEKASYITGEILRVDGGAIL
jgi:3-oxoacyl-[acyl-carrier protein] reductase